MIDITKSFFSLFSYENYKNNFNSTSKIILYILCIITSIYLSGQIIKSFNNDYTKVLLKYIAEFKSIQLCISILIIILFYAQTMGLSYNLDSIKYKIPTIIFIVFYLIFSIGLLVINSEKMIYIGILSILINYAGLMYIFSDLNDPVINKSCSNKYMSKIPIPMSLIVIGILILYIILMSGVSFMHQDSNQDCGSEFNKLEKCIEKNLKNTTLINSIKTNFQTIKTKYEKAEKNPIKNSLSCYKCVVSTILLHILVIVSGFNIFFLFIKPDLFIVILVIQRLLFGSYYEENSKLMKTWDLIGMPIIKLLTWGSGVEPNIYDYKVKLGAPNANAFNIYTQQIQKMGHKLYHKINRTPPPKNPDLK